MKKKIILSLAFMLTVALAAAGFSAYEAHVINVTATIENALSVSPEAITFGTVFPQEYIEKGFRVALSNSFLETERVDDISYFIRQKPKPRPWTYTQVAEAPTPIFSSESEAQHWCYENYPDGPVIRQVDNGLSEADYYNRCYYNLCPYLSKHSEDEKGDGSLNAFHRMGVDVNGYLAKSANDTEDFWTVDLATPCFEGMCAQDWPDFVEEHNPEIISNHYDWALPADQEGEMFGCDLWVEVSGVSRSNKIGIYKETGDESTSLGERIGTLEYSVNGNQLDGVVTLNAAGETWINDGHTYAYVLNGPRNGSTMVGSTNQLLASQACADSDPWNGGWWMRYTDNTGETTCVWPDPLPANYAGAEGYFNFDTTVAGSEMTSDSFTLTLPAGVYNEVQFLIKDTVTGWNTVGEYPGTGEIDGLTSYFDFEIPGTL